MHPNAIPAESPGEEQSLFRHILDQTPDSVDPADRRAVLARQLRDRTGLDDAALDRLVRRFYGLARLDPDLGPIFDAQIVDWEAHFARMVDFWASVGLLAGRYHRNALAAHRAMELRPEHFERWLGLFDQALQEQVSAPARDHLLTIARRIAATLSSRLCPS
ncbi:MAG: group III truncated hemoglobin [Thiomonas sp.]|uniref:group III truncated hemoglobin n=1 Tax=Thiomonas sp. TaxID=2047785 RepID=UPI002A3600E9|nr:group III truncated hemoglobin [Thiomonas sp.]MDY0330270.1 group III truncated hemoglobin [Thiomonas sp.]